MFSFKKYLPVWLALVFGVILLAAWTPVKDVKWEEIAFSYGGGAGTANKSFRHSVGDTLIDDANPDTIYFGLSTTNFPQALIIMASASDLNNAENMTLRLDKGQYGKWTVGTLDTFLTMAATVGAAGFKQYDFSSSEPAAENYRLILNQIASAAATDSVVVRLRIKAKYEH